MKNLEKLNPTQKSFLNLSNLADEHQEKVKKISIDLLNQVKEMLTNPNNFECGHTKAYLLKGYEVVEELIRFPFQEDEPWMSAVTYESVILSLYRREKGKSFNSLFNIFSESQPFSNFKQSRVSDLEKIFSTLSEVYGYLTGIDELLWNYREEFKSELPKRLEMESISRRNYESSIPIESWDEF